MQQIVSGVLKTAKFVLARSVRRLILLRILARNFSTRFTVELTLRVHLNLR